MQRWSKLIAKITRSRISGVVDAPQSKSLAIRLLFSALLGKIELHNLHMSDDVMAAISAVEALGVDSTGDLWKSGRTGTSGKNNIYLGGSGTTLRMLLPVLAYKGMDVVVDGDETLRKRPLNTIIEWLRENGVTVIGDRLPIRISGKAVSDYVEISGSESSQYISGFIFALLMSGGGKINILPPVRSASYIRMTCDILNRIGASVRFSGTTINVDPGVALNYSGPVPGDFLLSSFYAAAAVLTGGKIRIKGLELPEDSAGDSRIVDIFRKCGAGSEVLNREWQVSSNDDLHPFNEDVSDSPDMAVSLAALASVINGTSTIRGVELLKIKESDRISTIMDTLRSFGIRADFDGNIVVSGNGPGKYGIIDSSMDHRIAMLGTVLATRFGGTVRGAECVSKSNPRFYEDISRIGGVIELT